MDQKQPQLSKKLISFLHPLKKSILIHLKTKLSSNCHFSTLLLSIAIHCVKSVQLRSFFRSVFSRIWTEYGEIRSDKLQERALRAVCNDYDYSFNELFEKANRNIIHIKNTHILMTEIYKFLNGLSPPIMSKVSKKKGLPILFKKPKIINNQL